MKLLGVVLILLAGVLLGIHFEKAHIINSPPFWALYGAVWYAAIQVVIINKEDKT